MPDDLPDPRDAFETVDDPAIVCRLPGWSSEAREAHRRAAQDLLERATGVEAHPRGLRVRVPGDPEGAAAVHRFVEGERRCCPFARFQVDHPPDGGPVELTMTAPGDDAAEVLRQEVLPELQAAAGTNP